MIAPVTVTVVIDGRPVVATVPAVLSEGVVVAPIDPYLRLIAARIEVDSARCSILFEREGKSVRIKVPFLRGDPARIPLAAAVRALGATAIYDGRSRTLVILNRYPAPLVTMTPFASWTRPPGPLETFTPTPVPTPRPTVSGIPHPRRTPVLIVGAP